MVQRVITVSTGCCVARAVWGAAYWAILLLAVLLPTPSEASEVVASHLWNASIDTDGDLVWEDTGTLSNLDFSLNGGVPRIQITSSTIFSHAYVFDGIDDSAAADAENLVGNHDASIEIWFRPSALISDGHGRTIFENGNTPRGVSLGMSGSNLVLAFAAGSASRASLQYDLSSDRRWMETSDLIQVVGVVDDTANMLRMYVNGGSEQTQPLVGATDFSSNDQFGIAFNQGRGGGGQSATSFPWDRAFAGQIAMVRIYRAALDASQVERNYLAAVPEPVIGPAGFGLLATGLVRRAKPRRAR